MPTISTDLDAQIKAMLAAQKAQAAPPPAPAPAPPPVAPPAPPPPPPAPAPAPAPAPKRKAPAASPAPAPAAPPLEPRPTGMPRDYLPPANTTPGPLTPPPPAPPPPPPAAPGLTEGRRTAYLTTDDRARMAAANVLAQQSSFDRMLTNAGGWPHEPARQQELFAQRARLIGADEERQLAQELVDKDKLQRIEGELLSRASHVRYNNMKRLDAAKGEGFFDNKVAGLNKRYEDLRGVNANDEIAVRAGILQDLHQLGFTTHDLINQGVAVSDLVAANLITKPEGQTDEAYAARFKRAYADGDADELLRKRMRQDMAASQAYRDVLTQYPEDDLQRLQALQNRDKARRELLFERSVGAPYNEFTYLDQALDMLNGRIKNREYEIQEAVMRERPEAPRVARDPSFDLYNYAKTLDDEAALERYFSPSTRRPAQNAPYAHWIGEPLPE